MVNFFWKMIFFPQRMLNIAANLSVSALYRKKIRFDWRSLRIVHPENIFFGDNFYAGQGVWLQAVTKESHIIFGRDVQISDWSHIAALGRVTISDGCLIGSRVHITDHSHGETSNLECEFNVMPNRRPLMHKGDVFIESNVWIGDGAVILGNVRIGRGAIIAANAVVTKDVAEFSLVAGVPARPIVQRNI